MLKSPEEGGGNNTTFMTEINMQTQTAPMYSYAYTALTEQPFRGSWSSIL